MALSIEYSPEVVNELAELRAFDRQKLLNRIEEQLSNQPMIQTRNKKQLVGIIPLWEHVPPVWELRCGQFRVFYDVDATNQLVVVRAIRKKSPPQTTEEIL